LSHGKLFFEEKSYAAVTGDFGSEREKKKEQTYKGKVREKCEDKIIILLPLASSCLEGKKGRRSRG